MEVRRTNWKSVLSVLLCLPSLTALADYDITFTTNASIAAGARSIR